MDYSLLLGIHNKTQAERERQSLGSPAGGASDEKKPAAQRALYSTAMESIQGGSTCRETLDHDDTSVTARLSVLITVYECRFYSVCVCFCIHRMGGIPAVGVKGERLLLFIGIIDILQSYR